MFHSIQSCPSTVKPLHGASFFFLFTEESPSFLARYLSSTESSSRLPSLLPSASEHLTPHHHWTIPPPSTSPLILVLFSSAWDSPYSLVEILQFFPPSHLIYRATIPYQIHYGEAETRRERWLVLIWWVAWVEVGEIDFQQKLWEQRLLQEGWEWKIQKGVSNCARLWGLCRSVLRREKKEVL